MGVDLHYDFSSNLLPAGVKLPPASVLQQKDVIRGSIIEINSVFLSMAVVIVVLRMYTRLFIVRAVGADDACMALACIFAAMFSAMILLATKYGLGQHVWTLPLMTTIHDTMKVIQVLLVGALMYSAAVTTVKVSIILAYLRLFPNPHFRRFCWANLFVVLAIWFCGIWVVLFQCKPMAGAWDFTLPNRSCIPVVNFFYSAAAVGIVTDILLCTVPIPFFWKMQLPRRQRIGICLLFGIGVFACVASCIRLGALRKLLGIDVTYLSVSSLNWSVAEICSAIVCASVPSLKPLWLRIVPEKLRTISGSASRSNAKKSQGSIPLSDVSHSNISRSMGKSKDMLDMTDLENNSPMESPRSDHGGVGMGAVGAGYGGHTAYGVNPFGGHAVSPNPIDHLRVNRPPSGNGFPGVRTTWANSSEELIMPPPSTANSMGGVKGELSPMPPPIPKKGEAVGLGFSREEREKGAWEGGSNIVEPRSIYSFR